MLKRQDLELTLQCSNIKLLELKCQLEQEIEGSPQWETVYDEYREIKNKIEDICKEMEFIY